ncbi:UNKNOWN [Stylonychia lemnae]|uniref:LITAF domain-containing protein n=1 Tax=Stylonychia lemnae TaxID=5949 RepID=A0A078AG92_STYLE|nr:UNKNOWN [Stylonychia lemnae]|eukprot:CDW80522.1 UNKNOWN [Stylonychia lemnae]
MEDEVYPPQVAIAENQVNNHMVLGLPVQEGENQQDRLYPGEVSIQQEVYNYPNSRQEQLDEMIAQQSQIVNQARVNRRVEEVVQNNIIIADNENYVGDVQRNSWGRPQYRQAIVILNRNMPAGGFICPHCHFRGVPEVLRKIGWYQVLIGVLFVLLFPFFCIIPFCFDSCYEYKTYCANCHRRLKINQIAQ